MDVKLTKLEPMRVAFMRHVGPYTEVGETWGQLAAWAGPRGLFGPQTRCVGLCHDDPEVTPPEKIRYDACLTAGPQVQPEGEIGVQETPGGEYAMAVHHGPYENLAATYATICGQWLPQQGREPKSGPCLEFYLNSPQETAPARQGEGQRVTRAQQQAFPKRVHKVPCQDSTWSPGAQRA